MKPTSEVVQRVHARIDRCFPEHLERCRAFLKQPSVSSTGEGILETAGRVRGFIEDLGGSARFCGNVTHPIVFGRIERADMPNLIVYGMYDVMPVEPEKWSHPPFAADLVDKPRYGSCVVSRGSVNSKGALAGLFCALSAIQEVADLPLNLTFAIEGEEEIGSPHFESFVREHRDELQGIGVADFDFSEDSKHNVALHLGLKGIVYLELTCRGGRKGGGPSEPQHSSASAWIASPVWRLIQALSTLVDSRERITIDGLRENIAPISRRDLRLLQRLAAGLDEQAFLREMKALCFKHRISGVELLKAGLFLPVMNINGINAGYMGKGTKTILPRRAKARIDIRFGPNLEPDEIVVKFRRHLERRGFGDIEIAVREAYSWSKTDISEPIVQKLIASYRLHGREPQVWPMATWTAPYFVFSRILGLPVVAGGLGFGDRAHSPDEFMTVEGLRDFEKWVVTFLFKLAE